MRATPRALAPMESIEEAHMTIIEAIEREHATGQLDGTRYRAVRRLGGGATSEVFEAEAPNGTRVAVKVLGAIGLALGPREAVARFEREARALATIKSDRLVRLLEVGATADARPYFVMPLLDGEDLRARMERRGALPLGRAVVILLDVLSALDAAHARGIVHRDVKPSNVFVTRDERALLLDFGIARVAGERDLTSGAHAIGTPRYLAPEQILGGAIDARTDVYAAGLLLLEMLTGEQPFSDKAPFEAMYAHVTSELPSLASRCPVPEAFDRVVRRALAKTPAKRWPSARAFAGAITAAAMFANEGPPA